MSLIRALTRTRDRRTMHITDWLTYGFLLVGVVLMFGPALWLAASSLKTKSALQEFPPSFLPMGQKEIKLADKPDGLPVYLVPDGAGQHVELALQRHLPVYFYFDGLVFDFKDKWHRADGELTATRALEQKTERLAVVEADGPGGGRALQRAPRRRIGPAGLRA